VNDLELPTHFFRHEYAKTVAILVNRFGPHYIETVEDAVQSALLKAIETWPISGVPRSPSAWIVRVSLNRVLSDLRQQSTHARLNDQIVPEFLCFTETEPVRVMDDDVQDDLLRMLFACCDNAISEDAQLVLMLRVLCGFSVKEIAIRLFISEQSTYKRLSRARKRFQQQLPSLDPAAQDDFAQRLVAVQKVLYLMFTEGYLSLSEHDTIRHEVCGEAIRLTTLLARHSVGDNPSTHALLALMHLHRARMNARLDVSGGLLMLEEQNRALWDQREIETGITLLAHASQGNEFSRYHAEAGVAAEHCIASSYQTTRWDRIIECYSALEQSAPSPMHTLNRVIALAEWKGAKAALAELKNLHFPAWLTDSFWWAAVCADLYLRSGDLTNASKHEEMANRLAPTTALQSLLQRRLNFQRNAHVSHVQVD